MDRYFISYDYSFSEIIQKEILMGNGTKTLAAPEVKRVNGNAHCFVELDKKMKAKDWDGWCADFEETKGKEILEADFEHRDYINVIVKNISKLS